MFVKRHKVVTSDALKLVGLVVLILPAHAFSLRCAGHLPNLNLTDFLCIHPHDKIFPFPRTLSIINLVK